MKSTSDMESLLMFQLIGWSLKDVERSVLSKYWYLPFPPCTYFVHTLRYPNSRSQESTERHLRSAPAPGKEDTGSARVFHQRESLMAQEKKRLNGNP